MIENPIITGFNPDPNILRINDTYYLAVSSFEWMPGIPIYMSKDLKNWKLYIHAITRESQAQLNGIGSALGVWAPNLSYNSHTKKYYMCYSVVYNADNNNFDVDNFAITASEIKGPWSEPIYLNSSGFDPAMFHDDDGTSWVVNLEWDFRQGYEHPGAIIIEKFDNKTDKLIGDSKVISRGATNRGCLEGPNIYKRNGYYYLITAEGGTGYGHCVSVSRAKNIEGPYEGYYGNPIITSQPEDFNERGIEESAKPHRYNPDSYLQKSGHGNIVETTSGEVYMTHLCSRPLKDKKRCPLGRETAIQKCIWTDDDWIKLDSDDNLAKRHVKEPDLHEYIFTSKNCRDVFNENTVLDDYYSPRQAVSADWLTINNEGLCLRGQQSLFSPYNVSLLCKKVKSFCYEAHTCVNFNTDTFLQMAGLTNYYNNKNFYYLRMYYSQSLNSVALGIIKADKGVKIEYLDSRVKVDSSVSKVYLKCNVIDSELQYYYATQKDKWIAIGPKFDISILSDEYAGGFTGSFVGVTVQDMYKRQKCAQFEYFYYKDK